MKKHRIIIMSLILLCSIAAPPAAALDVSAKSAILYDPLTETVIFEKNAHTRMPMASTTKIMTAVVALQNSKPDDIVQIRKEYTGVIGSSIYLKPDEKLTMSELLYGMMLSSGNDAATAIAGYIAGGNEEFAELMNQTAQSLDLKDTSFSNPSGLDGENHYTTASDLACLAAYAMNIQEFSDIVSQKTYKTPNRYFRNHNKLLWQCDGAEGVKTGYTDKSGRCLVSCATREGRRLIVVTLNAPNDWKDHTNLLNYGFEQFRETSLIKKDDSALSLPVVSGDKRSVMLKAGADFSFSLSEAEKEKVTSVVFGQRFAYAPVLGNTVYGELRFILNGKTIGSVPLFYGETVSAEPGKAPGFFESILNKIANLFSS